MEDLEYLSHSDETRSEYNYRMKELYDMNSLMTDKFREGIEKGRKKV